MPNGSLNAMAKKNGPQAGHYVILREMADNTYSALGPAFYGYDDPAAADAAAKARGERFPQQTFVVLQCITRHSHEMRAVVTHMVETPPKPSELEVVQFPRSNSLERR